MTDALRDPQPARRLKPLLHFRKPVVVDSKDSHGIERADIECSWFDRDSDHQMLEEDFDTLFEPFYHGAGHDCDILDNLDEINGADDYGDYELDLFEEYEERLRSACEHKHADGTELLFDNDYCSPEPEVTSEEASCGLLSPMLEPQEKSLEQGPPDQTSDTALAPPPKIFPASSPLEDLIATSDEGGDVDWTDLLDEEVPNGFDNLEADKKIVRASTSLEDEYEPSFEQWEFDREQGYDDMLFD